MSKRPLDVESENATDEGAGPTKRARMEVAPRPLPEGVSSDDLGVSDEEMLPDEGGGKRVFIMTSCAPLTRALEMHGKKPPDDYMFLLWDHNDDARIDEWRKWAHACDVLTKTGRDRNFTSVAVIFALLGCAGDPLFKRVLPSNFPYDMRAASYSIIPAGQMIGDYDVTAVILYPCVPDYDDEDESDIQSSSLEESDDDDDEEEDSDE